MKYTETEIEGVWLIEPRVFDDARGYFFEAWKQADFDAHVGGHVEFVQDNESMSARGVLRGLHYQKGEFSQAKQEALGDDFDQKMMAMIEDEYTKKPNKAKVVSLTERLKPLFKAAAVVAIILTLGNAVQVPFQNNGNDSVENVGYIKSGKGVSVAMGDSASVDSMQRTGIDQVSTPTTSPTLLK